MERRVVGDRYEVREVLGREGATEIVRATDRQYDRVVAVARAAVDYARMLLERRAPGDTDRAQRLLTGASRLARDLGMAALLADADTLRATTG